MVAYPAVVAEVAVSELPVTSPVTAPLNVVAVITPVIFAPPDPVIYLLLISKSPPSLGVLSKKTEDNPLIPVRY